MPDSRDVYVIDDDEAIRQSLSFLLRSAGLRTRMFGSAEAFLAEAARLGRGCVITDVRMPGMDGVDLVRRMREMGLSHRTIVMSGHGDVTLAVDAMTDMQADAHAWSVTRVFPKIGETGTTQDIIDLLEERI